ncbi:MAG: UDP-N-acetylglucosamine 2-epimerase (non-hydrolyzing) [Clostridiaceae bacterium]|nr:UDP-N-acetylglucosamine 2-epimerase (non-hydrolyzing) [Clostridiaceae bacterium]
MLVFGTRPETIKMAPLVKVLRQDPRFQVTVCVTAQHRQMLDQVLHAFDIVPDADLDIMRPGQTLSDITSRVLKGMEDVIREYEPDVVLVHGDTSTAYAAALAAFYQQVPVAHVEAGLRTWNRYSPYPEEMNRQMIDVLSELYFAPTERSIENLRLENRDEAGIYLTGNTAIDALQTTVRSDWHHEIVDWSADSRLIVLTAHRRENLGKPMRNCFRAIARITTDFPDVKVVYPVHMNPLVRDLAAEVFGDNERVRLIEPLDVIDFHNLLAKAYIILTDSGGIQEEAPSLGKPVVVLRDTTERPEGLAAGTLVLAGTDEERVYALTAELLSDTEVYNRMSQASNPYGDGLASLRIRDALIKWSGSRLSSGK